MSVLAYQETKLKDKEEINQDPFYEVKSFFESCVQKNKSNIVRLFSHKFLDPDGLGAMVGLDWLLRKKYGISSVFYCDGPISNPQNIAMAELLLPPLTQACDCNINDKVAANILLDTMPSYAGTGDKQINFDVVIDHHKDNGNGYHNILVNLSAGSCCGIIYSLIKSHGISFNEENEEDSKVATALMVGIMADTDKLASDDCSEYEFQAYSELFTYRNPEILKKVIRYKKPLSWVKIEAKAVQNVKIQDAVAVVGLGLLSEKQRDLISLVAAEMTTWDGIETAIAFAIIDGIRIEGSVRSNDASVSVSNLCKQIGGKFGSGGGKLGAGAYQINLAGLAIDPDDEDQIKEDMVNIINEKEISRIYRLTNK